MLTTTDPLESVDFDPVQFINDSFPSESSLDDLDTFVVGIGSQIYALDEEISLAVQAQSSVGKQATKVRRGHEYSSKSVSNVCSLFKDIFEAQESIHELYDKIQDIKSKAAQSERMVQEICADIKKLDYAKSHLQSSITALKRLQMLITAVGQLEVIDKFIFSIKYSHIPTSVM